MRHRYIEHALVMLDKVNARAESELGPLDRVLINWKPDDKSWSVAECLDHLIVTNARYFKILEGVKQRRISRTFWAAVPGWSAFCSRTVLKSVDPENTRKMKTFKVFQPSSSDYPRAVIDSFIDSNRKLKTYLHELDGFDDHKKIKFSSPANKAVVLDLESAINILWKHEVRHLNQAVRVTTMPGFP